jgi:hypothetical protein
MSEARATSIFGDELGISFDTGVDAARRAEAEPAGAANSAAPEHELADHDFTHSDAARASERAGFGDAADRAVDPIVAAVLARDLSSFLRRLVSAAAQAAPFGAGDERGLGVIVAQLGQALEEGFDEAATCRGLILALERRHLPAGGLREAIPAVSALLARIAAQPLLHQRSAENLNAVAALVHAAEAITIGALDQAGLRGWRPLPGVAATIARWAERHDLSIGALADALPQLAARLLDLRPREANSDSDRPRGETSRGGADGEPRRMVLSGPVEIVFLDR